MPGTQQGTHPNGTIITFEEDPHTYTDDAGRSYKSITSLIHDYFPQFDAEKNAARLANKRGKTVPELLQEWAECGEEACRYGTRVHENCEALMKGMPTPNRAENETEDRVFAHAVAVTGYLKTKYQFIGAERILFSPRCHVAGTVDLMMADGNTLWILDYKTNKEIKHTGHRNERGLFPLTHLDNCNFNHYSIQLSLAEVIAKMEGYIPRDTPCRRALIHFPHSADPEWIETPDRSSESYEMLIDYTWKSNCIPF
jgi:ATP-dependent exoDNAse (exonuclease V) beta subunit